MTLQLPMEALWLKWVAKDSDTCWTLLEALWLKGVFAVLSQFLAFFACALLSLSLSLLSCSIVVCSHA